VKLLEDKDLFVVQRSSLHFEPLAFPCRTWEIQNHHIEPGSYLVSRKGLGYIARYCPCAAEKVLPWERAALVSSRLLDPITLWNHPQMPSEFSVYYHDGRKRLEQSPSSRGNVQAETAQAWRRAQRTSLHLPIRYLQPNLVQP
jgi:hypothetical protein